MRKYLFLLLLCLGTLAACNSDDSVFKTSPTTRAQEAVDALKQQLVSAPYGWRVLYFSRTDSLLYTQPDQDIPQSLLRGSYGYGGHCFTMRFTADNKVEMRADYSDNTATTPEVSEFSINRNSFAQLSFVTYSYLHQLVNERFEGSSDWLFMGVDPDGALMFRTAQHLRPAREYIRMVPLKSPEGMAEVVQKSVENRQWFEGMLNPQLRIHRGGRVYFQSDYFVKRPVETNASLLREIKDKRFYLFVFVKQRNPIPDYPPKSITGLGSGYVGTEQGLTFRAGLRYDKKIQFYDFVRNGDKFEAELVEVYDTLLRTTRYVSRHLHPEGRVTGLKAEIWDAK